MIPFDQLEAMVMPLEARIERFYTGVLVDSSKSLSTLLRSKDLMTTTTWYADKLLESKQLYNSVIMRLAKLTPYTEAELRDIFERAGISSLKADAEAIRQAGLKVPEFRESKALTGAVNSIFARTNVVLQNLTRTVAYQSQMQFIAAADDAYLAVTSGALGIDQAVKQGVLNLVNQGVNVLNSATGRTEQLDVAVMRNVRTAVNQATGDMTLSLAAEAGTDYVEVSAHAGARDRGYGPMNHASWQGKVYSISGNDPKYQPFVATTGYGTGEGLLGYNCRHSVFLAFPGFEQPQYTQAELDRINNTTVSYQGKEMGLYDATQEQRAIERHIREWKRKQAAFEAAGLGEEHAMAGVRVDDWQAKMRDFIKQTGLERRPEWEQVAGVKAQRPAWGKAVEAK